MLEDQNVTYYEYGGEALAVGEETFTTVDTTSTIVDHGPVTTAKINIKATAVGTAYASATTDVDSNSDISILINFKEGSLQSDGVTYDISRAKFIGVSLADHVDSPGGPKKVIVVNHGEDANLDPALFDNVAMLSLDAEVVGDTTYLSAETATLTTDTVSISAIEVIAVA